MNRALGQLFLCFILSYCAASCSPGSNQAAASSGKPQTTIENKGSDTMVNLALAWAEAYQLIRPEVSVSVTGGGSGTGIAALINNSVDIANASREIKEEEEASAIENGVQPVEFTVAETRSQ